MPLSSYNQDARRRLIRIASGLISDDVDVFITEDNDYSPGWCVLNCKKHHCIMTLNFDRVMGVSLTFDTKPNRVCGTGFACLPDGLASVSPAELDEACRTGWRRYYAEGKNAPLYQSMQDYFRNNQYAKFVKLEPEVM